MVRTFIHAVTLTAMLAAAPVQAQSLAERGPGKFQAETAGPVRTGAGAELRLTIPLGGTDRATAADRTRVDLNAGPMLAMGDAAPNGRLRSVQGGLVNVRLTPGHSARLNIAGQSVAVRYGPLAADEDRQGDDKDGDQEGGGPSTLGWIGIGLGAVVVVTLAAGAIALGNLCDRGCD